MKEAYNSSVCHRIFWLLCSCIVVLVSLTACSKVYFIPSQLAAESLPEAMSVHYFFKRNASMGGFTGKGADSAYVRTLDYILSAGEYLWEDKEVHKFYEYGTLGIYEISKAVIENEAKTNPKTKPGQVYDEDVWGNRYPDIIRFYRGGVSDSNKHRIKDNEDNEDNKGPFRWVVDYIDKLNSKDPKNKCLYIVVSNLLEQKNADDVFVSFFRNAFKCGQSGALFAVNSSFLGRVFQFDEVGNERLQLLDFDGESTFYILIAGSGNEVAQYGERLERNLKDRGIDNDHVFFMQNTTYKPVLAPLESVIEREEIKVQNQYDMVNCWRLSDQDENNKLYHWQKSASTDDYKTVSINFRTLNVYQLKNTRMAQYFAGLPVKAEPDNFDYSIKITAEQYINSKPIPGEPSLTVDLTEDALFYSDSGPFWDIPDDKRVGNDYPLYIAIKMTNWKIKPGFYHINYRLIVKAREDPGWVIEKSVSRGEYSQLLNSKTLKVVDFRVIYKNIAEVYNLNATGESYSGDIYFIRL